MSKPKQKPVQVQPSLKGMMTCDHGHRYSVRELNPEKKNDPCPVCGTMTNIQKGFENASSSSK